MLILQLIIFQMGSRSGWLWCQEFDLNGDKMLNYIKLSYQGIALADGKTINVCYGIHPHGCMDF
jgi:hypothetical protein